MLIEALRMTQKGSSPNGHTMNYFMDVAINEEELVAIAISQETFMSLTNITAELDPPLENPENPMGLPA